MRIHAHRPVAVALAAMLLVAASTASAQTAKLFGTVTSGTATSGQPIPADHTPATSAWTPPTAGQLKQLLAPVAVFPDSLVAEVFAAASHPEQVSEANAWLAKNASLKGASLARALDAEDWDPGVKAIVAFPDVLHQLADNMQWTNALGEAYVNDPTDVMNTVQTLRNQAVASGHLKSGKYLNVTSEPRDTTPPPVDDGQYDDEDNPPQYDGAPIVEPPDRIVEIAPAIPDYVYVPYYDPTAFYGYPIAWWPGYYYAWPTPAYYGPAFGLLGFGAAIAIDFGFGHPWGWGAWGARWGHGYYGRHGWRGPGVVYEHRPYFGHSRGIVNHYAGRGAFAHAHGAGHATFAQRGATANGSRTNAFHGPHTSPASYARLSAPHFDRAMVARDASGAGPRGVTSRANFSGNASALHGPARASRAGALASSHYAQRAQSGYAGRSGVSRANHQRSSRGNYAPARGSYASASNARSYMARPSYSAPRAMARSDSYARGGYGGGVSRGGGGHYSAPRTRSGVSSPARAGGAGHAHHR